MNIGTVLNSPSAVADLTRLAVAAQTVRQPRQDASVAVQALEQRNVEALASGSLDTYA